MSEQSLIEVAHRSNPNETSLETTNVINYELGDLVKMLFYSKLYPDRKRAYMIEAKIAMSDLITQCRLLCMREGWNFEELMTLGDGRMRERVQRRIEFGE